MTLVIPVHPIPGEHLPGLMIRAAAANHLRRVYDVLICAGVIATAPQCMPVRDPALGKKIAAFLGSQDDRSLEGMFWRPITASKVDFLGVDIRKKMLELNIRRVSPRSLARSPHCRSVWQVRPLSFDPDTLEVLLSNCPQCGLKLGFNRTWGPAHCDHCTAKNAWGFDKPAVDLRDFPQPLVQVADEEALRFVSRLVNPEVDQETAVRGVPPEMCSQTRGELFELTIAIVVVKRQLLLKQRALRRPNGLAGLSSIAPDELSVAGRILLNWSKGFPALIDEAVALADHREGYFGMHKVIGPLAMLAVDVHLSPAQRGMVRGALAAASRRATFSTISDVRDSGDWLTLREAAKVVGKDRQHLTRFMAHPGIKVITASGAGKAPSLISRAQLEAAQARRQEVVARWELGHRTNLPPHAMAQLAASGLLELETGPVVELMTASDDTFFACSSANRLERVGQGNLEGPTVPLRSLMLRYRPSMRPWAETFSAILLGHLVAAAGHPQGRGLCVGASTALPAAKRDWASCGFSDASLITDAEAGRFLGISSAKVIDLVRAGRLKRIKTPQLRRTLRFSDVIALSERFVFTMEVAARLELPSNVVARRLTEYGVTPASPPGCSGQYFHRESVESLLSEVANAAAPSCPPVDRR